MKKLFLLLLMLITTFVHAQTGKSVSGKISDSDGQPLPGATVKLLSPSDSSSLQSAITNSEGEFLLTNLNQGNFRLMISMIGFKPLSLSFRMGSDPVSLPIAILQVSSVTMNEVKIVSRKNLIEQKIDRTIVNVDAMLSTAGGNALEILEKSPGVMVGQNGALSLNGKGATIFIDGKPSHLSGSDLKSYLQSLPSAVLDQIELMNNPPAKYDAAGNGGVINIRTKKTKIKGINGGANFSYIQGNYARTNSSFNINYFSNKINISANLGYITTNNYSNLDINRNFEDAIAKTSSSFLQNSFTRNTGESLSSRIGLDYYISDKTTFGLSLTGIQRPNEQNARVQGNFYNSVNQLDSTINALNREKSTFKNGGINLNFRHEFEKPGREITFDLDYLQYNNGTNQTFLNNSYLANGTLANSEVLEGSLPTEINIYSFKTDYNHQLKNGIKLSAGLKANITLTDNEALYFNTVDAVSTPDYSKTNHFTYKENINAAYINANKEYKRLTVQLGLRLENSFSKGDQLGNLQQPDSTFKRNYTSLFPTLYLQYKVDTAGNNLIGINYGRRIDRPYYQDLNPFVSPIDKFTYYTGNPFLKPSYSNSVELSHTCKNLLTTTLSYSKTLDQVNETIEILDGVYYSRPGNIGQSTFKSVSVNGSLDLWGWLTFNLFAEVFNIHASGSFYTGYLDTQGTFFYLQPLLQFKLKNDWTFQIDGYYQSKVTNVQFVAAERNRMNAAVSKKLSSSSTIKLVLNDIFHSYVNAGIINNLSQTRAGYRNVVDTRTAVLTFSYRFGKTIAGKKHHDGNSTDSEQSRVKN